MALLSGVMTRPSYCAQPLVYLDQTATVARASWGCFVVLLQCPGPFGAVIILETIA